jgi:hypothetical protein
MIGDSLREHPGNVINKFDRDLVKAKLMNGSYALVHVSEINIPILVVVINLNIIY